VVAQAEQNSAFGIADGGMLPNIGEDPVLVWSECRQTYGRARTAGMTVVSIITRRPS